MDILINTLLVLGIIVLCGMAFMLAMFIIAAVFAVIKALIAATKHSIQMAKLRKKLHDNKL